MSWGWGDVCGRDDPNSSSLALLNPIRVWDVVRAKRATGKMCVALRSCSFYLIFGAKCFGPSTLQIPLPGEVVSHSGGSNSVSERLWYQLLFQLLTALFPFLSAGGVALGPDLLMTRELRALEKCVLCSPVMKESVAFPSDKGGKCWKGSWGNKR